MTRKIDLSYDALSDHAVKEYIIEKFSLEEKDIDEKYFVYVLTCHESSQEKIKDYHETFFGELPDPQNPSNWDRGGDWIGENPIPDWAWAASYCQEVLYVGSTNNIIERISEHMWGDTARTTKDPEKVVRTKTKFTKYFPPKDIKELILLDSLEKARKKEKTYSQKLKEKTRNNTFVFSY